MSGIRTVDFDRLATSAPLNKQAAIDYHATGDGWVPEKDTGTLRWEAPPPMRLVPPHVPDLTGLAAGRLKVVGLQLRRPSENGQGVRWVVRCACGAYETRRSRTLAQAPGGTRAEHMCAHCDYLEELKAGRVPSATVADRMKAAR